MKVLPRPTQQILDDLAARLVSRGPWVDLDPAGLEMQLLATVADEIAAVEYRQSQISDATWPTQGSGDLLVARAQDLILGQLPPLGPTPASGTGVRLTFVGDDVAAEIVIPAGTVYGRSDDPSVHYVQQSDVTKPAGQATYPLTTDAPIRITATSTGGRTNARAPAIDRLVSGPTTIAGVAQAVDITGGTDGETDAEYRGRLRRYLATLLGTSLAPALELAALSFVASNGTRIRFAKCYEDPTRPGYTELLVDDGAGMTGYAKKGATTQGTVPLGDTALVQTVIFHENPATAPVTNVQFTVNGAAAPLGADGHGLFVSLPERGLVYPLAGCLAPGDTWQIAGYSVWTGPIAELQAVIEGRAAAVVQAFGRRAAGTRVRVVAPAVKLISGPSGAGIIVQLVATEGANLATLQQTVKTAIATFVQSLAPGDPMFLSALVATIQGVPGVRACTVTRPTADYYPPNGRTRLYIDNDNMEVY